MPLTDPILDEIHAVREAIAKESEYDPQKIAAAAREREAHGNQQAVTLTPRPPVATKKKAS